MRHRVGASGGHCCWVSRRCCCCRWGEIERDDELLVGVGDGEARLSVGRVSAAAGDEQCGWCEELCAIAAAAKEKGARSCWFGGEKGEEEDRGWEWRRQWLVLLGFQPSANLAATVAGFCGGRRCPELLGRIVAPVVAVPFSAVRRLLPLLFLHFLVLFLLKFPLLLL